MTTSPQLSEGISGIFNKAGSQIGEVRVWKSKQSMLELWESDLDTVAAFQSLTEYTVRWMRKGAPNAPAEGRARLNALRAKTAFRPPKWFFLTITREDSPPSNTTSMIRGGVDRLM